MTDREKLVELGYDNEMLETMTDEDCEDELVEIQTNGD